MVPVQASGTALEVQVATDEALGLLKTETVSGPGVGECGALRCGASGHIGAQGWGGGDVARPDVKIGTPDGTAGGSLWI